MRGKSDWLGGGGGPRVSDQGRVGEKSTYFPPRYRPMHTAPERIVCYHCGQEGHIKPDCPAQKPKGTGQCCFPGLDEEELGFMGRLQTVSVFVGAKETSALIDTGSSQTLVQTHLVDRQDYSGKRLKVICVNGDEHEYPVAKVYLEVQGQTYELSVGVVECLSHSVVLGQDDLVLPELVQANKPVNVVITRSQARSQDSNNSQSSINDSLRELPFYDSELVSQIKTRVKKSRMQRRREKLVGGLQELQDGEGTLFEGGVWEELSDDCEATER